jgi:gas vesicle protein
MGFVGRVFKFALGGVAGAAVGATAALLLAPESGQDLQRDLRDRIRRAKIEGIKAQVARETELIRKYRAEVNDPDALRELEAEAKLARDQAVAELGSATT